MYPEVCTTQIAGPGSALETSGYGRHLDHLFKLKYYPISR